MKRRNFIKSITRATVLAPFVSLASCDFSSPERINELQKMGYDSAEKLLTDDSKMIVVSDADHRDLAPRDVVDGVAKYVASMPDITPVMAIEFGPDLEKMVRLTNGKVDIAELKTVLTDKLTAALDSQDSKHHIEQFVSAVSRVQNVGGKIVFMDRSDLNDNDLSIHSLEDEMEIIRKNDPDNYKNNAKYKSLKSEFDQKVESRLKETKPIWLENIDKAMQEVKNPVMIVFGGRDHLKGQYSIMGDLQERDYGVKHLNISIRVDDIGKPHKEKQTQADKITLSVPDETAIKNLRDFIQEVDFLKSKGSPKALIRITNKLYDAMKTFSKKYSDQSAFLEDIKETDKLINPKHSSSPNEYYDNIKSANIILHDAIEKHELKNNVYTAYVDYALNAAAQLAGELQQRQTQPSLRQ